MKNITIFDYLLLPVYLSLFYIIVRKISVKYTDSELRKYFLISFYLHMFGAVAYALMVQYYYGYGDSFVFYYGGNFLNSQLVQDPNNIKYFFKSAAEVKSWFDMEVGDLSYAGYFGIASNLFIMKISALLALVSFNKYLIITLFFGFFSFSGLWRLFLVFKEINEDREVKVLAWAILFVPSVWFWGSGLMKDSICIGGVGFIIYFLHKLFIQKIVSIKSLAGLIAVGYMVLIIKSYIIIALVVGLVVFIFYKFITPFKNIVIRGFIIMLFLFAVLAVTYMTNFTDQLQLLAEESMVQVDAFKRNYEAVQNEEETSRGGLEMKDMDLSLGGMLLNSPVKVFTCLYRPFIWESRSVFILFSSLESMLLLLSTLYVMFKLRFLGFFREMFNNPFIFTSLIIALFFAVIIGFTTYNFGTMARYKIVLIPFYAYALVGLYSVYNSRKKDFA